MKTIIALILSLLLTFVSISTGVNPEKPSLSISFDDGSTQDFPGYPNKIWNEMFLESLKKHDLQAIFYVKGIAMDNPRGKKVVKSWDNAGHLIANHTYSHKYYHSKKITLDFYKNDFLRDDKFIKNYKNYTKFFRFPYLKAGNTIEKRDGFRKFLSEQNYRRGYVSIDASDWFIDSRLCKKLETGEEVELEKYKKYYIEHMMDRASYYDSLGYELTGRQVKHTLLFHHNLAAALFMDDLITAFKAEGWEIIDPMESYSDPIYEEPADILPDGESIIWAKAKQSGKFDDILRYPAEDGDYLIDEMDKLGL